MGKCVAIITVITGQKLQKHQEDKRKVIRYFNEGDRISIEHGCKKTFLRSFMNIIHDIGA